MNAAGPIDRVRIVSDVDRYGAAAKRLKDIGPTLIFIAAGIGAMAAVPAGPVVFPSSVGAGAIATLATLLASSLLKKHLRTKIGGLADPVLRSELEQKLRSLD